MSKLSLRALTSADATKCASLVLDHYADEPGYAFVWGTDVDKVHLRNMYSAKIGRLIGEDDIRTWCACDNSGEVVSFVAWNPRSYRKSWSLYFRQKWASSRIWSLWPLSIIYPTSVTRTPLQARHAEISRFRQALENPVNDKLGDNIWVMHYAGLMAGVDRIIQEKVIPEAQADKCAIRFSAQHSELAVQHAKEAWECDDVARGVFHDAATDTKIPVVILARPATKS